MLKSTKEHCKCIAGAVVYNIYTIVTRCALCQMFVQACTCFTTLVLPMHATHPAKATYSFAIDVFYFLSFGYRVETVRAHYKRRTNIKTYTTLYYISVLLVSLVWILSICHFSTVFPEILMEAQKAILTSVFELRCVLLFLFVMSSGNCARTLQATYKHQNLHNVILY